MQVTITLADAAAAHPDGTFSLLRGGITQLCVPANKPVHFRASAVIRIVGEPSECAATHTFALFCINEDGGRVLPEVKGTFSFQRGRSMHIVVELAGILPKLGRYELAVTINDRQEATWPLEALEAKPNPKE